MRFEVEVGGRRRLIEARRAGADWQVTLDGRTLRIGLTRIGDRWSLLVGPDDDPTATARRSYDVAVEEGSDRRRDRGERIVHVNGAAVRVLLAEGRGAGRRGELGGGAAGAMRVVAPMPGRIVKVLAGTGDAVAAGQGLVIVEAMKMENELRAPRAGTVTEVRVAGGASVEAGAVLVVIE